MRGREVRHGILVGILVVASIWLVSLIWSIAGKAEVAVRQEKAAKQEYDALEARKGTLQANLVELDTPRGKDAAIREAFGVAKAGEEVIVVVPPAVSSASSTKGFWARWFGWL